MGGWFNTRIMAAIPPLLTLKLQNLVFPCLWHLSSHHLSARAQGEYLCASESMCKPFKKMPGCPLSFLLTQTDRIFSDFHNQMLWRPPLPGTSALGWRASVRAGIPYFFRGTSAIEIFLLIFNHHTWLWNQPTSHLCPSCRSWRGFFFIRSFLASLQMVLQVDCFII